MNDIHSLLDESTLLDDDKSNNYEPDSAEIKDFAIYLGMSLPEDNDLLYLAKEGLKAPLPEGWTAHRTKSNEIFYLNESTGQKAWEHPSDDFYRKKYQEMKALKNRSSGKREEAKLLKQLQIQQKLYQSTSGQAPSALEQNNRNNTASQIGENTSSLNYSNNFTTLGDHSICMNQCNRGNDSTVIRGSPIFSCKEKTESPISRRDVSNVGNSIFLDDGQKSAIKLGGKDELQSGIKCNFDDFKDFESPIAEKQLTGSKELGLRNELGLLVAEGENNEINHDDDHSHSEPVKLSDSGNESLNLSEFNLELETKSEGEQAEGELHSQRGFLLNEQTIPTQRSNATCAKTGSSRAIESQIKLQRGMELIDRELDQNFAVLIEGWESKLKEHQKGQQEAFEIEKQKILQNFEEELGKLKQEIDQMPTHPEQPEDAVSSDSGLEFIEFQQIIERAKQEEEAEFIRKVQDLQLRVEKEFENRLKECGKKIKEKQSPVKRGLQTEVEELKEKIAEIEAKQQARCRLLETVIKENEKIQEEIQQKNANEIKRIHRLCTQECEEEIARYKSELNQKLIHEKRLSDQEREKIEAEIVACCSAIQRSFEEKFEIQKKTMAAETEAFFSNYYESEKKLYDEDLTERVDIDRINELKRKINDIEVDRITYEQVLKDKLEETRSFSKLNLSKQIEMLHKQVSSKEAQLENIIATTKSEIEYKTPLQAVIKEYEQQMLLLEKEMLQSEGQEVELLEQIQQVSDKIAENQHQLKSLKQQSSSKLSESIIQKKKELLATIDKLHKSIDVKGKEISALREKSHAVTLNESISNQNQNISLILRELEDIKQTLKTQNHPTTNPKPVERPNIYRRAFLFNNSLDSELANSQVRCESLGKIETKDLVEDTSENECTDDYGLRNSSETRKYRRESLQRDSSIYNRSLQQQQHSIQRESTSLSLDKTKNIYRKSANQSQGKIGLWKNIIHQEEEALETAQAFLQNRKIELKQSQMNLKEEQKQLKIDAAAYQESKGKLQNSKQKLVQTKKVLNEHIKNYNDELVKLKEDEKTLRDKKLLLTSIKMTVDSFQKSGSWSDLELEKHYSKYKEMKFSCQPEDQKVKTLEMFRISTDWTEEDCERENRQTNFLSDMSQQSSVCQKTDRRALLNMSKSKMYMRGSEEEDLKPTKGYRKFNQSTESRRKGNSSPLSTSFKSSGLKRNILLNQSQDELPRRSHSQSTKVLILQPQKLRFERGSDRNTRLFENLTCKSLHPK